MIPAGLTIETLRHALQTTPIKEIQALHTSLTNEELIAAENETQNSGASRILDLPESDRAIEYEDYTYDGQPVLRMATLRLCHTCRNVSSQCKDPNAHRFNFKVIYFQGKWEVLLYRHLFGVDPPAIEHHMGIATTFRAEYPVYESETARQPRPRRPRLQPPPIYDETLLEGSKVITEEDLRSLAPDLEKLVVNTHQRDGDIHIEERIPVPPKIYSYVLSLEAATKVPISYPKSHLQPMFRLFKKADRFLSVRPIATGEDALTERGGVSGEVEFITPKDRDLLKLMKDTFPKIVTNETGEHSRSVIRDYRFALRLILNYGKTPNGPPWKESWGSHKPVAEDFDDGGNYIGNLKAVKEYGV